MSTQKKSPILFQNCLYLVFIAMLNIISTPNKLKPIFWNN